MPSSDERDRGDWLVPAGLAAHILTWVGPLLLAYMVVPRYKAVFEDLDVELPRAVIALITVSNFVINYWYVLGVLLVMLLAADAAILSGLRTFSLRLVWILVLAVPPLIAVAWGAVVIQKLMTDLRWDLS